MSRDKLGKCYQCGGSIGHKSPGGRIRVDHSKFCQVNIVFNNEDTNKKTSLHVPVCYSCMQAISTGIILDNITDKSVKSFIMDKKNKYKVTYSEHVPAKHGGNSQSAKKVLEVAHE